MRNIIKKMDHYTNLDSHLSRTEHMTDFTQPIRTYLEEPSAPTIKLPTGACDAHVHVFGPGARFPYAPTRSFTPVDAPKEKLFALHKKLGIERCVIVQSAVHGLDNSVMEDAIQAGGGNYLGIALTPADVTDSELRRLADAGIRGVRFNFMKSLGPATDPAKVVALTRRLEPLGMHLQVHFEPGLIDDLAPFFKQCPTPVVIDHMARLDATLGIDQPVFKSLCKLLELPRFMVKISGIDRIDATPPYKAGIEFARHLATHYTDRCVWGTDWPHPNHTHIPDDGQLVDSLSQIMPDARTMAQILVHNPESLYRFET